ncbi:hypothetical protein VD0002_g3402 [Verticillium dahliae]|uniref:Uncharacterized protein n=2 Tax=Verticillium dahliae TaxID=27337 RepID=G2WSN6_VERDV|nr:uncharacterized protein VDAG_00817 [Verticillium dahliae VdLs.17]KAF3343210.1 Polyamine transporter TPO5 [Verticillium dahliae VDG2]KAH6701778.1 hypothetical protein EV126DRAFT_522321 [Verticillium dahliae]EGY17135.1 hypothetical protein VDAG_00817 [Verticillium dahliae VdLs.17]PNH32473.1 hypothetical protein BJF96_g4148 [Verticillium dahliae]PNH50491.1 hypothetical protein VD0003_g6695 [Verticillium dahliae]
MQITSVLAVLGLALGVTSAAVEARQLTECTPIHTSKTTWGQHPICCDYFGPSASMENCCDRSPSMPTGGNYCGTHFADKDCPRAMPFIRTWAPEAHLCCNGLPQLRCCDRLGTDKTGKPLCSSIGPLSL